MVKYPDLQSAEFAKINPLKKVPALVRGDGTTVFESAVILSYLEDRYQSLGPPMVPATPVGRQEMELLIRVHDLYIASPNCTAPGFSHSQGAMYLSHGWHGAARGMDLPTRAAKMAEIWKQLNWLEAKKQSSSPSPFLVSDQLTLADMTWYPTCVFMEFLLPRFFGWPHLFDPQVTQHTVTVTLTFTRKLCAYVCVRVRMRVVLVHGEWLRQVHKMRPHVAAQGHTPFPHLAVWYTELRQRQAFASVRDDIWQYWETMEQQVARFPPPCFLATSADPHPHVTILISYSLSLMVS